MKGVVYYKLLLSFNLLTWNKESNTTLLFPIKKQGEYIEMRRESNSKTVAAEMIRALHIIFSYEVTEQSYPTLLEQKAFRASLNYLEDTGDAVLKDKIKYLQDVIQYKKGLKAYKEAWKELKEYVFFYITDKANNTNRPLANEIDFL